MRRSEYRVRPHGPKSVVQISVNGWTNPIQLAGEMVRLAGAEDVSPERVQGLLCCGALAIRQLHDQIRDSQ